MLDSTVNRPIPLRPSDPYSSDNLNRPALTLTGKELLRLDTLTDAAQGRVFMLQTWCSSSGSLGGVPASEARAVEDVFEQAWKALDEVRALLKLDDKEGGDNA
ncbi:hypothetical protein [Mailhella massiliensis]|uniref:hypothetical protein n=1 Tax=Mailhella massiliensis TaxID=1903261 RepID=UPI00118512AA|nr:hypothetical protein [Mailhella massiliensis]